MLIGIISDTHNQVARTAVAVEKLKAAGAQVLFHCGDLVEPGIIQCFTDLPYYFVFGNNDEYYVPAIELMIENEEDAVCLKWGDVVELAGKRIAMTHGHLERLTQTLLASEPDFLFSGHTHVAGDWKVGNTRRINPGALYRARSYSVALLSLETDELQFIDIPR